MATRDERNAERIGQLRMELQPRARAFLSDVKKELGIDLFITQTRRSWEYQSALFAQGRLPLDEVNEMRKRVGMDSIDESKNKRKVTAVAAGYSSHNFDCAFDVAFHWDKDGDGKVDEGEMGYEGPWEKVGEIGERHGFKWGGRWKGPTFPSGDKPHFEDLCGYTLAQLRAAEMEKRGIGPQKTI